MNALFRKGPFLKVISRDGEHFGLLEEKEVEVEEDDGSVTRYLMPATGSEDDTDGASIPAPGQLFGLDHYGDYWSGAVWHDFAYRRKLLLWDGEKWVKAPMDEQTANRVLKALMFGLGTDVEKRDTIYNALVLFGAKAWNEDATT